MVHNLVCGSLTLSHTSHILLIITFTNRHALIVTMIITSLATMMYDWFCCVSKTEVALKHNAEFGVDITGNW